MPKAENIPACPPPNPRGKGTSIERTYRIELITPMFGGGVVTGETDLKFPIRPTAIRGHLRHWWRIVKGTLLGDKMWQREEEIFGSVDFPSPLSVEVLKQPTIELVAPEYGDRFGPIAYALFPAVENNQKVVKHGKSFEIRLNWECQESLVKHREVQNIARIKSKRKPLPDLVEDISSDITLAVDAWLMFGGVGARTRRGCGALWCTNSSQELTNLPVHVLKGKSKSSALEAWKSAVKAYQQFRQTPRGAKHKKTIQTSSGPRQIEVPGRSQWPEADSIRVITGCALRGAAAGNPSGIPPDVNPNDHSTPVVPKEYLPAFPKAVLGLPINFHFADGPGKHKPGHSDKDPQDCQLIPVLPTNASTNSSDGRMASPVITRPLHINGCWHPAIIILPHELPEGITFRLEGKRSRSNGTDVAYDLSAQKVYDPSLSGLKVMRGKASAIEALVDYVKREHDFEEVTL